jgi:hypothetical protein
MKLTAQILPADSERKPERERLTEECAQNIALWAASICPEGLAHESCKGGWSRLGAAVGDRDRVAAH